MISIKGRSDFAEGRGDKYSECIMCGPLKLRAVIHFDSGSVAPTVGETITGATSADTGVLEYVILTSGSYAGGDAAGTMIVNTPTGYAENLSIFADDENLNGSTAGDNFATVNGICGINKSGRLHPDWNLIEYEGKKYCKDHFSFRFKAEWMDESRIDVNDNDRYRD
mgnify:CR=1 FL=1